MAEIDTLIQARAPLASPALTGTPTAPTPATADNSTKIATTAYVKAQGYLTSNAVTSVFGRTGAVVAQAGDYSAAQVTNAADLSQSAVQTFAGAIIAPSIEATVTGVAMALVGGVSGGPPSTGTWFAGDFVVDKSTGDVWACTTSGTPGVWSKSTTVSPALTGTPTAPTPATADNSTKIATTAFVKAQGYLTAAPVSSVFGRTGAVVAAAGDYTAAQVTNAADKSSSSQQSFSAPIAADYFAPNAGGVLTAQLGNVHPTQMFQRITSWDAINITTITHQVEGILFLRNSSGSNITFASGGNIHNPPVLTNGNTGMFVYDNTGGWYTFITQFAS